jgi:hypothetical protein
MSPLTPLTVYLPEQIDRMARRQSNEKLAFVMTGLTIGLLAVMALKECKSLFREERERSR